MLTWGTILYSRGWCLGASINHPMIHGKRKNFQENLLLVQLTFKAEFCGKHTRACIHFLQASILKNLWKVRNLPPRGHSKARSRFLSLWISFPPRWNTGSQFRVASKFSHFRGPMLLLSSPHRAQFLIPTQKYSRQIEDKDDPRFKWSH